MRLGHRDALLARVHDEDGSRYAIYIAHAAEIAVQLRQLVVEALGLFLREFGERALFFILPARACAGGDCERYGSWSACRPPTAG